jgi:hypothetical protein
MYFYRGQSPVVFYFFSNQNPADYLPANSPVKYIYQEHSSWVDATNSKFKNILSLSQEEIDYIFYFDADTSVNNDFTEDWFIGELVGGEHYANNSWMKERKNFDRNPRSKAYVSNDTTLPQMYYYGAFFGGRKQKVLDFCDTLMEWQIEDKKIPYEPAVNDESYINAYFHYNPPTKTVRINDFAFAISDKSGIGETRNTALDVEQIKNDLLQHKNNLIDICNGKLICLK